MKNDQAAPEIYLATVEYIAALEKVANDLRIRSKDLVSALDPSNQMLLRSFEKAVCEPFEEDIRNLAVKLADENKESENLAPKGPIENTGTENENLENQELTGAVENLKFLSCRASTIINQISMHKKRLIELADTCNLDGKGLLNEGHTIGEGLFEDGVSIEPNEIPKRTRRLTKAEVRVMRMRRSVAPKAEEY